jgi:Contact-dependent growth inhibition CdiA C-terminal domain
MDIEQPIDHPEEESIIELGYEPQRNVLLIDISGFSSIIKTCFTKVSREIQKIFSSEEWYEHYKDKATGRRVLSESEVIEHNHEKATAILLAAKMNFDVVFAPKAFFQRIEKKFDVFLLRDTVILKADLKSISSKNPDTIANRIKDGFDQASRVVIEITSDIEKKDLITGLRSGAYKNKILKKIILFYQGYHYTLPKNLIESKRIYDVIK